MILRTSRQRALEGDRVSLDRLRTRLRIEVDGLAGVDGLRAERLSELIASLDGLIEGSLPEAPRYPARHFRHAPLANVGGGVELLVLGQCKCGWRCACPEGWTWPMCPNCGRQVMPPWPPTEDAGRLAYVAQLFPEPEAVRIIRGGYGQ